jgi:hypothetical protein
MLRKQYNGLIALAAGLTAHLGINSEVERCICRTSVYISTQTQMSICNVVDVGHIWKHVLGSVVLRYTKEKGDVEHCIME